MTNLKGIPAQDDFETTLSSTYNGGVGSMGVFHVPDSTLPVGEYTYAVIEPGTPNMQVVKISGWTSSPKTLIVSDIAIEKASGVNYTAKSHPTNSIVRISNNYQFWKDIQNAINSKADPSILGDYSFSGNEISVTGDVAQLTPSGADITISTSGDMKFQDQNVGPITLSQMINPPLSGSAIEVMSEADFQQITPAINTAYMRYETGDDKLLKMYFNGSDYRTADKDIHDLTEKTSISLDDEFVIADSDNSYDSKKIKFKSTFQPTIDVLVVGGGGGGGGGNCPQSGASAGGGGGGGMVVEKKGFRVLCNSYSVSVGAGGLGKDYSYEACPGCNSSFGGITALGGKGGIGSSAGIAYCRGGGDGGNNGNGNSGGFGQRDMGGGGGGAGGIGTNGVWDYLPGNGGAGIQSDISGDIKSYGGGGGGGSHDSVIGCLNGKGNGGGGDGGTTQSDHYGGCPGTANTGGGGGGGGYMGTGGTGGSGVVIVSYLKDGLSGINCATGGTVYCCGDYVIHCFTSDGTFCIVN